MAAEVVAAATAVVGHRMEAEVDMVLHVEEAIVVVTVRAANNIALIRLAQFEWGLRSPTTTVSFSVSAGKNSCKRIRVLYLYLEGRFVRDNGATTSADSLN